jgi:hypothetical protein
MQVLYSRMQPNQSTERRIQTSNIEELVWNRSGKPLTKRELADILGVVNGFSNWKLIEDVSAPFALSTS